MKSLSKDESPVVGKLLNEARTPLPRLSKQRAEKFSTPKGSGALGQHRHFAAGNAVRNAARLHPLTQMLDRGIAIFRRMGFALADGPDIETEWHCFDALNTPPDHPARNEQDTFYLPGWPASAHPHFHRANPHDAIRAAADPGDRAGRRLSPR